MSGYSINDKIKPGTEYAHIENFFTSKGKDLYCVVPSYGTQLRLRDFKAAAGATVNILGCKKPLVLKQAGKDCTVDLSGIKPGDISAELFVVKLTNAL